MISAAKALNGKVVLGGHSLGGSVVTAYATWDFGGEPGAQELSGLVYDDGGSSPIAITKAKAEEELAALEETERDPVAGIRRYRGARPRAILRDRFGLDGC